MFGRVVKQVATSAGARRCFAADAKIVAKRSNPAMRYREVDVVGADNPTYLKEKGDTAYVWLAFAGLTVGLANIFGGLYNMSYGINKVKG